MTVETWNQSGTRNEHLIVSRDVAVLCHETFAQGFQFKALVQKTRPLTLYCVCFNHDETHLACSDANSSGLVFT